MVMDDPSNVERIASLKNVERNELGMTVAQQQAADDMIVGLKLDGWIAIMDCVGMETGLTRDQVILMWIKFDIQHANSLRYAAAEKALETTKALQARLDPILKMIEREIDEGDPPWK